MEDTGHYTTYEREYEEGEDYEEGEYVEGKEPEDLYSQYRTKYGRGAGHEYPGGEGPEYRQGEMAEEDLPVSWIEYDVEYGPQSVEPPGMQSPLIIVTRRRGKGESTSLHVWWSTTY